MSIIIAPQTRPPCNKYARSNEFISKLKGCAFNPNIFAEKYAVNVEIVYRKASLYRGQGLPIPILEGEPPRKIRVNRAESVLDAISVFAD